MTCWRPTRFYMVMKMLTIPNSSSLYPSMETLLHEDTNLSLRRLDSGPIREVTSLMQRLLTDGTVYLKLLCVVLASTRLKMVMTTMREIH